uniref:Methyltransferase small domain-containing protein n=1 Tax=Anopheles culicifacies TaxID=139723 RepID=A0A182MWK5_9DIPT
MACIKLKHLEQYLQTVDDFKEPKVLLEQYQTPSHIASQALYAIQTKYSDLEGRLVLDLGCGPGMLSIGAALLGADFVVGVEIDPNAAEDFRENCDEFELHNVECFQADVMHLPALWSETPLFDTVLLNPPFGTKKNSGIDVAFLRVALMLARGAVYSLHKSATRQHIKNKAQEWNVRCSLIAELRYNLQQTYKFHRRPSVDIAVDLWRFECNNRGSVSNRSGLPRRSPWSVSPYSSTYGAAMKQPLLMPSSSISASRMRRKIPIPAPHSAVWYVHEPTELFSSSFWQQKDCEHSITPHTRHMVGLRESSRRLFGQIDQPADGRCRLEQGPRLTEQLGLARVPHPIDLVRVAEGQPLDQLVRFLPGAQIHERILLQIEIRHHRVIVMLRHIGTLGQLDIGDAVEQQATAPQQRVALRLDVVQQLLAEPLLLRNRTADGDVCRVRFRLVRMGLMDVVLLKQQQQITLRITERRRLIASLTALLLLLLLLRLLFGIGHHRWIDTGYGCDNGAQHVHHKNGQHD